MFRTTLLATSCALLIGGAAFAQSNETTDPALPPMDAPQRAELPVSTKNMFGIAPANTTSETEKFGFVVPKEGQLLISSFIGRSIYESDAADAQSVGKLNDLITSPDGQIIAAVIGVGGFLGLGEKDVAVSPDQLLLSTRSDGQRWLVIKATKDELAAAPTFDRSVFFTDGIAGSNDVPPAEAPASTAPQSSEPQQ